MKTYTCSYPFDGRNYALHVDAANEVECSRRLRAIGMNGRIDGELIAEIPVEGHDGWLTKLRRIVRAVLS